MDAGHGAGELVQEKALAAADIEDAIAGLQAVVLGHGFGDRQPAAVVPVAAVSVLPLAVPVVLAVLLGDLRAVGLVVLDDTADIVALGPVMQGADEIYVSHLSIS